MYENLAKIKLVFCIQLKNRNYTLPNKSINLLIYDLNFG